MVLGLYFNQITDYKNFSPKGRLAAHLIGTKVSKAIPVTGRRGL
jgi:hypothetical protein